MMPTLSDQNKPMTFPSLTKWGSDEWRTKAACKGVDPNEFFTTEEKRVRVMKQLCDSCPVKSECLQFALTNDIAWGIYGGMTPKERNRTFKHVVSQR